jgi:uncharacterized protein (TIGR02118 family)
LSAEDLGCCSTDRNYASAVLVEKIPGVERWEAARVVDTMEGDAPPYHRIFEFWFKDLDGLQASMGSPEGQAAVADIPNYATGGATTLVSEVT